MNNNELNTNKSCEVFTKKNQLNVFFRVIFFVYQWLIAVPLFIVSTIITSILTLILSPLLPNNKLSYWPAIIWGKFCCFVFIIRVKVVGKVNLDAKQSYVFVSNHQSMFDILAVYGWIPYIFKWVMKKELRKVPFLGAACKAAGHIFLDRSNPIEAKRSLKNAAEQLKNGVSVFLFPEGTRTQTGEMGKFKRGAFNLASELNLPIAPITISGSFERLKTSSLHVFPGTITLTFHPPIIPSSYETMTQNELISTTWEIINKELLVK